MRSTLIASLAIAAAIPLNADGRGLHGPYLDESARGGRPSVLLVTVDTLRFDRTGAAGAMPHLRRLSERGVVFTRAHAQVPLTLPSHATILTGLGPLVHGVRDNVGYGLPSSVLTVAERFREAGYATAAFLGSYVLGRETGLSQGFDTYDDAMTRAPAGEKAGVTERRAEEVIRAVGKWLHDHAGEPYFLWVHLFDPHEPYDAPATGAGGSAHPRDDRPASTEEDSARAYDDEVAYTDHWLGVLLDKVEASTRPGHLWIVVCSDHGESLGEHGEATHGVFLYESTLHVPLVIVPPGGAAARVVDWSVGLADVAPTLLEAAHLEGLSGIEGRSLMSLIVGGESGGKRETSAYLESLHGRRRYGWAPLRGKLDWPWKYIEAPRPELYDLSSDSGETRNLIGGGDQEPRAAQMNAALHAMSDGAAGTRATAVDDQDLARLESLGYVGSSAAPVEGDPFADVRRPDPKDRIAILRLLDEGLKALDAGQMPAAEKKLAEALDGDPGNLVALNNLGIIALQKGDAPGAEAFFRRGLAADPSSEKLANDLGLVLSRQGRHEEAVEYYRRALSARPRFTAARFNMAIALQRLGKNEEALRELKVVESEDPRFPGLHATIEQVKADLKKAGGR